MTREERRRRVVWCGALGLLAAITILPAWPAAASNWLNAPDVEEPAAPIVRRPHREAAPPPAQDPASVVVGAASVVVSSMYGAAAGLLSYGQSGIVAVAGATSEAIWETSYALGMNVTAVPRADLDERQTLATPASISMAPALPSATVVASPSIAAPTPPPVFLPRAGLPAAIVATSQPPPAEAPRSNPAQANPAQVSTVQVQAGVDAGLLANFIYDTAARRPDGTFFVPKPLQRLFAVRTQTVSVTDVPVTFTLAGRIIPDPHTHGHVEASLLGRIAAPPSGLPVLGDAVTKGQVLGFVLPAVGLVDRTQMRREVARLTTEIRIETESMERLKQFFFVPFRQGKIYQSEVRVEGLRRERAALLPMLDTQEVLRAPTDGVISIANAIEGGIVHPGDTIFDVVNPARLWIEAVAPDPAIAQDAALNAAISARTPEGQTLQVSFIGSGLALRQQATPMLFRIDDPPSGLRLDRPVTVAVQGRRTEHGIPIPRAALTSGSDGVQQVWEQTGAETFLAHPVRTQELDGETALVMSGLAGGAHIVSGGGVRLMAQLQ